MREREVEGDMPACGRKHCTPLITEGNTFGTSGNKSAAGPPMGLLDLHPANASRGGTWTAPPPPHKSGCHKWGFGSSECFLWALAHSVAESLITSPVGRYLRGYITMF